MKARWIVLAVSATLVLALTAGFAIGATSTDQSSMSQMHDMRGMQAACDETHRSSAMKEMLRQTPAGLVEQCDERHARMQRMMSMMQQMGSSMGGSVMSGGTNMMGGT